MLPNCDQPRPACATHSLLFLLSWQQFPHPRTIFDPELPGEQEYLYFVMVELNMDDIRELKRVTQLEMKGTLDADALKTFVEVTWLNKPILSGLTDVRETAWTCNEHHTDECMKKHH